MLSWTGTEKWDCRSHTCISDEHVNSMPEMRPVVLVQGFRHASQCMEEVKSVKVEAAGCGAELLARLSLPFRGSIRDSSLAVRRSTWDTSIATTRCYPADSSDSCTTARHQMWTWKPYCQTSLSIKPSTFFSDYLPPE